VKVIEGALQPNQRTRCERGPVKTRGYKRAFCDQKNKDRGGKNWPSASQREGEVRPLKAGRVDMLEIVS